MENNRVNALTNRLGLKNNNVRLHTNAAQSGISFLRNIQKFNDRNRDWVN
jgi:hypothetical protein